ncbi:MAG TPA: hypothetical protein PK367_03085 [Candidatus Paceibacterota bacterium]|nr:hypothetical protein [Candidatus Paceibacterota bacterium]
MTLTTHALIGATAAQLFPKNPLIGFFVAFLSHFIIDMIPHWDYKLKSVHKDPDHPLGVGVELKSKKFLIDISKITLDLILGIGGALLILQPKSSYEISFVIFTAFAGQLPDGFQFLYVLLRIEPLKSLQWFHNKIQTYSRLDVRPLYGISLQAIFFAVFFLIIRFFS